jgi:S-adenosylmethionine hydrolase
MPLLTLTTDFGTRDSYVAELKGVLLNEGPASLRLIDLSHELLPFDIHAAALFLRSALPRFPRGTIHLAVVDPGVGSERRALIVERPDMLLVGPDNALFSYLFDGSESVYAIEPARLGERVISSTFHGRDLFAPVAARLAAGAAPASLGQRVTSYERMVFPMIDMQGDVLHGRVVHIDHYGNIITNISEGTLRSFLGAQDARFDLSIGDHTLHALSSHYAQVEPGALLALVGSSGLIELAAREQSAARKLAIEVGRPVRVHRRS